MYTNIKKDVGNEVRLQNLVNSFPKKWLANHFGVTVGLFNKLCKEWGVEYLGRGFWTLEKLEEARLHLNDLKSKNDKD